MKKSDLEKESFRRRGLTKTRRRRLRRGLATAADHHAETIFIRRLTLNTIYGRTLQWLLE